MNVDTTRSTLAPFPRDPAAAGHAHEVERPARPSPRLADALARQRTGRRFIVAGFVVSVVGVVLYCVASFAGGLDADMGDLLFRNSVPYARATLGIIGLGTLVWLVGSVKYLHAVMDGAEEDGAQPQ